MTVSVHTEHSRFIIASLLLAGLMWLGFLVLREFLITLAWAFIISYTAWPLYQRLKQRLNDQIVASAAIMTLCMTVVLIGALYGLLSLLQTEVSEAYQLLINHINEKPYTLPDEVRRLPWLGNYLQTLLERLHTDDRAGLTAQAIGWAKQWLGTVARFLGSVGQHALRLCMVLVTVFFCFRDGEQLVRQIQTALSYFLGQKQLLYWQAAGNTTRAVVYGLVLAALAQGAVAGVGYAATGVQAPVLLGALTALLALIPLGATLVWVPVGLFLCVGNHWWAGTGLLLWGFLVVSTVDNVIRPLVICGASQIPFLVVMFGVFGGLSAFGAVGLFLGPIILSVLLAVWQVWISERAAAR